MGEIMSGVDLVRQSQAVGKAVETEGLSAEQVSAKSEGLGKCVNPATGEPVTARREETAVSPVAGSVAASADGNGRGTCPFCGWHGALSGKGFITAHRVRSAPESAPRAVMRKDGMKLEQPRNGVRLVERRALPADTGARVGSPEAAMRTRGAELEGVAGTGTVAVTVSARNVDTQEGMVKARIKDTMSKTVELIVLEAVDAHAVASGMGERKSMTVRVPQTVANIRTALRQEMGKRQREETVKDPVTGKRVPTGRMTGGPDMDRVAMLGAMLRGATGDRARAVPGAKPGTYRVERVVTVGQDTPDARDVRPREHGTHDGRVTTATGTALVQGRGMSCELPTEADRVNARGGHRNAIGWSEPVGRTRPDNGAVNGCQGTGCTVPSCPAIVGGGYGSKTCHEFRQLSKRARNRYWATVSKKRKRLQTASREARAGSAQMRAWVRAEVERLHAVGEGLPACGW